MEARPFTVRQENDSGRIQLQGETAHVLHSESESLIQIVAGPTSQMQTVPMAGHWSLHVVDIITVACVHCVHCSGCSCCCGNLVQVTLEPTASSAYKYCGSWQTTLRFSGSSVHREGDTLPHGKTSTKQACDAFALATSSLKCAWFSDHAKRLHLESLGRVA